MLLATKCVTQHYPDGSLDSLLNQCLSLTYNAIHYAEENNVENRKGMKGFYQMVGQEKVPSCYKVATITRACAILKSRKKSQKRGVQAKRGKPLRMMVCIISGFFITAKGRLFIPLRRDRYFDIQLNHHVIEKLAGKKMRSLTISQGLLSLCYSQDVEPPAVKSVSGVDRNEKNITSGNSESVVQVDMSKAARITQTTREILGSFRRNDMRVRRKLARKYWKRAKHRTDQMIHAATNYVVERAARKGAALALEDLKGIRKMYRKRNGQGSDHRFRLNSWPHWKAKHMLEYKAAWRGVTIIPLTKSDTYGSSSECSTCGEKLHRPEKGDVAHGRRLWCQKCEIWMDRDVNAALNLSRRGLARLASSRPRPKSRTQGDDLTAKEKGLAGEAVKGNGTRTLILRVDASKLASGVCQRVDRALIIA